MADTDHCMLGLPEQDSWLLGLAWVRPCEQLHASPGQSEQGIGHSAGSAWEASRRRSPQQWFWGSALWLMEPTDIFSLLGIVPQAAAPLPTGAQGLSYALPQGCRPQPHTSSPAQVSDCGAKAGLASPPELSEVGGQRGYMLLTTPSPRPGPLEGACRLPGPVTETWPPSSPEHPPQGWCAWGQQCIS